MRFSLFLHSAVLALLLSNRNQVTEGATITVSPSSLGLHSLTIQRNITTSSASLYEPKTTTLTTNVVSSVNFTSSASPAVKRSILFSRYTKTVSSTVTTAFPTTRISVTQSNYTTTPTVPTTVLTVKGLPDGSVIAVMAGILGAILLILFGIIVSISNFIAITC